MIGKVAVLYGGTSPEREVSLQSGQAVFESLQRQGIDSVTVDAVGNYIEVLKRGTFERVFVILHGGAGENGCVQGLLESLKLPYTGSGVLGSALSMDKICSKRLWQNMGIATPPFCVWYPDRDPEDFIKLFGLPIAVKPACGGSTQGVTKVNNASQLKGACNKAASFGPVMAEPWIAGDEYTVPILAGQALPSILIRPANGLYDYDAKYLLDDTEFYCPSPLDAGDEKKIRHLALAAFQAIGAANWGRVDIIRDLNGDFWVLEVNTIPGLTDHSLFPRSARVVNLDFDALVFKILSMTQPVTGHLTNNILQGADVSSE